MATGDEKLQEEHVGQRPGCPVLPSEESPVATPKQSGTAKVDEGPWEFFKDKVKWDVCVIGAWAMGGVVLQIAFLAYSAAHDLASHQTDKPPLEAQAKQLNIPAIVEPAEDASIADYRKDLIDLYRKLPESNPAKGELGEIIIRDLEREYGGLPNGSLGKGSRTRPEGHLTDRGSLPDRLFRKRHLPTAGNLDPSWKTLRG